MRVALQVVHHCHANGVIHRDLKLANFMLSDPSDAAVLKAIDFGASCYFQPGASWASWLGNSAPGTAKPGIGKSPACAATLQYEDRSVSSEAACCCPVAERCRGEGGRDGRYTPVHGPGSAGGEI